MSPIDLFLGLTILITVAAVTAVPMAWLGSCIAEYMFRREWDGWIFAIIMTWWTVMVCITVLTAIFFVIGQCK